MSEQPELTFLPVARYLSLKGTYIDELGSQPENLVTKKHVENRLRRDGEKDGYHITVVNHLEIATLSLDQEQEKDASSNNKKKTQRKTLYRKHQQVLDQCGLTTCWEKPVDLGLGICRDGSAVSYFRVIHWPFGQELRRKLGLGFTNFHITVGFHPNDVHLYKGPASLVCLQENRPLSRRMAKKLISYVPFYFHDKLFLKRLYYACWSHAYYAELATLSGLCVTSFLSLLFSKIFRYQQKPKSQ
ncbi:uncharacterized protein B0P05DRAFT_534358 [Gilbertella persicaria]|uniref:Swiss Army Knife 2H phosphoesterase domain-containing protein n=1 Tax=Rhizopus stolonifer TaxID=4846 RepID=A0A367KP58_RHIST|nr:uncharacterized protein B0P05DRAFT_534358 [Gilbertella persicaria]KAI8085955.1 hypothetical protein B0P05DRAFT_534358 [Gilbertella persicaria]RCI03978.1 hypothetical protein CU098_012155 [Rhizopus stolonifer]